MLKTLAEMIDELYELRAARLAAQKEVDKMQAEETALVEAVLAGLASENASAAGGKRALAKTDPKVVPQVKDWEALHRHVKTRGHFDLLQKRVSDTAVKERWEQGLAIPGVEPYTIVKLSLTKR